MPNWATNSITITGKTSDVQKFIKKGYGKEIHNNEEAQEAKAHLSSWYPIPDIYKEWDATNFHADTLKIGDKIHKTSSLGLEEIVVTEELLERAREIEKEMRTKYGVVGWYDYNCKHFGTKWDSEVELNELYEDGENTEIKIWIESAWSAVTPWLSNLVNDFPDLTFEAIFEEESFAFVGKAWGSDGEYIEQFYDGTKEGYEALDLEYWAEEFEEDDDENI